MSITVQLKSQHKEILSLLAKANELGLASEEGRKHLASGKELILNHLKIEDTQLYPKLNVHAETKKISEAFSTEMKELVSVAVTLFQAVDAGKQDVETAVLLGKVYAALQQRINREEADLYPKFDQIA